MKAQSVPSTLPACLADRLKVIMRVGMVEVCKHQSIRQKHLSEVAEKARNAITTGDAAALREALRSVDLVSFELCED